MRKIPLIPYWVFTAKFEDEIFIIPTVGITTSPISGLRIVFAWLFFCVSIRLCDGIGSRRKTMRDYLEDDTSDDGGEPT